MRSRFRSQSASRLAAAAKREMPWVFGLLLASGCEACARAVEGVSTAVAPTPAVPDAPPLDLFAGAPLPPEYLAERHWQDAARGDAFALGWIADHTSLPDLFGVLDRGGQLGRIALGALRQSAQAHAARVGLCGRLARATPRTRDELLSALLHILLAAHRLDESVDTSDDATCEQALMALRRGTDLGLQTRDLVESSLASLRAPQ